ncbi:hypothetical protein PsalN5692_00145 [Piscirickettsia salmonis]|nr:hypothetical protein PsalN5692_00145 [Piscirickettsia salmonis]QGP52769.1 hypothetical protein PsalSR1_00158 [Piscirickettsia salmonis]QGP57632.1 hypothetical protein PsalBI1_00168 [Piscirickettsia salmonis]QGP62337.1 hypothetical protein PsalMR5_00158 [Piscirickettsia salmonis]
MDLDFENLNINCKRAAFSIGPYIELTLIIKINQISVYKNHEQVYLSLAKLQLTSALISLDK